MSVFNFSGPVRRLGDDPITPEMKGGNRWQAGQSLGPVPMHQAGEQVYAVPSVGDKPMVVVAGWCPVCGGRMEVVTMSECDEVISTEFDANGEMISQEWNNAKARMGATTILRARCTRCGVKIQLRMPGKEISSINISLVRLQDWLETADERAAKNSLNAALQVTGERTLIASDP